MKYFLIVLIQCYARIGSAFLHFLCGPGCGCRFTPTCSEYAMEAIRRHGAWHGLRLSCGRLLRCQPWGGCGYDPVPVELKARGKA